jgi:hypothetical protein
MPALPAPPFTFVQDKQAAPLQSGVEPPHSKTELLR